MTKILILSNYMDAHARIVLCALKSKGITAERWIPENYLQSQKSSFSISTFNKDDLLLDNKDECQKLNFTDSSSQNFRALSFSRSI